jgi:hypothetical protein
MWGMARRRSTLIVAAAIGVGAFGLGAGSASPSDEATAAADSRATVTAAAKCKRAFVGGRRTCLRVGKRCKRRFQDDYVRVGLACRRRKLRRATVADLRGQEPLLVGANGEISLRTALAAFDQGIADLPGIKARKGEIGDLDSGTMIVNEIQANLGRLSARQQEVFRAVTTPAPDAVVVTPGATGARAGAGRRAAASQSQTIVGSGTLEERLEAVRFVGAARTAMQTHGFPFPHDIKVSFLDRNVKIKGNQVSAYVPFDTLPPGRSPTCNIFVTKSGRAERESFKRLVYAHETAHCTQQTFFASEAQADAAPDWVIEGSADWMGGKAVEELGHSVDGVDWDPWLEQPDIDLFKRTYSAAGFFAMVDQVAGDGWPRIAGVLSVAAAGSERAYLRAWAGLPEVFHDRWGPGLARKTSLGAEWDYTGPGIPGSKITEGKLGNRTLSFPLPAHASNAVKLDVAADVVIVRTPKNVRGLMVSGGKRYKLPKAGAFCAKNGGCKCKSHTNLQLPRIAGTAHTGFNALHRPGTVSFQGRSLKDYCKKPKPGPGGGGGESCPTAPGPTVAQGDDTPSCPAPAPGIQVLGNPCDDNGNCTLLATFKAADCTVGGGFTAISSDGAWRLEVGIGSFSGFGGIYDILWGGGNVNVVLEGPGGPYSNTTWVPPDISRAGAVAFPTGTGSPVGVGWIEFRPASGAENSGVTGAGQMSCAYPEDD